jgi:alpha-N-arabinofuranosidase
VDSTIQVSACGSSGRWMPTFGAWEYEVLEHTFDVTDFISLHMYYENPHKDVQEFLANIEIMDRFTKEAIAVCDAVAAKRRSPKRIMLSFDEWNVWYKARSGEHMAKPGWPIAPPLLEEVYDLQDALMVGGALITLLNNSDRVKVACLAQLVNVIGPILTEPGAAAWRQTIFHPFKLVSRHARGNVLQTRIRSKQASTKIAGPIDHIVASAVHDVDQHKIVFFVLNRDTASPVELSIVFRGFPQIAACNLIEIAGTDLLATNTAQAPDAVQPSEHKECSVKPDKIIAQLPALSWSTLLVSY